MQIGTKAILAIILLTLVGTSIIPAITGNARQNNQPREMIKTMQTPDTYFVMTDISTIGVSAHTKISNNILVQTRQTETPLTAEAAITQPLNNDIYRAGDILELNGTAGGTGFQNYTIEWGIGEEPTAWFNAGITLTNDGTIPVENNILATWNTSVVPQGDYYTIRLTVVFTDHQTDAQIKDIYLDPTLRPGWPLKIDDEVSGPYLDWNGYLQTVIDDLNHDGQSEIIVFTGGNPPKIKVFTNDGSLLWMAPIGNTEVAGGNSHIPLVDDINNDGFDEIIIYRFIHDANYSEVYAFDHAGHPLPGFPVHITLEYLPTVLAADVNGDGFDEMIIKGNLAYPRNLTIIDHTGTILAQWTLPNKDWSNLFIESNPAIGNFDADPEPEIVCAGPSEHAGYNGTAYNNEGRIDIYNDDGTEVPGWPIYTMGVIFSSPAVADINGDGAEEIITPLFRYQAGAEYGGVYAFNKTGAVLPGFPFGQGKAFVASPSLADFDHDTYPEIAVSDTNSYTYVIDHDGSLAPGWPQHTTWPNQYSTITGDINNDGIPDIITTAGDGFYPNIGNHGGVYAWTYNGTLIPGFPKVTEVDAEAPANIADIDGDGKIELIASSDFDYDFQTQLDKGRGTIYIWELDAAYNNTAMPWPTFHHDRQLTGLFPTNFTPPPVIKIEIGNITGGFFTLKSTIKNTGEAPIANITWTITCLGKHIFLNNATTGHISSLNPGDEQAITSKPVLGFGKTPIHVIATTPGCTTSREQNATIWLCYIIMK